MGLSSLSIVYTHVSRHASRHDGYIWPSWWRCKDPVGRACMQSCTRHRLWRYNYT